MITLMRVITPPFLNKEGKETSYLSFALSLKDNQFAVLILPGVKHPVVVSQMNLSGGVCDDCKGDYNPDDAEEVHVYEVTK